MHPRFNSAGLGRTQRPTQRPTTSPSLAKIASDPAVWSLTVLTGAISDSERQRFREAFADFTASRGLQIHFSHAATFIAPTDAPITTEDRGAVMGWLCARPEVHFVHVRRRPPATRSFAISCSPIRGKSLEGREGRPAPFIEAEDISQDTDPDFDDPEARHAE